ncbi:MAG: O-antigen ligase-related protein [Candidatus Magasanikbacteria bacterium]|nr:O-antigen ligase-related protein [Candidatus Magasanikbacteria bacterium]
MNPTHPDIKSSSAAANFWQWLTVLIFFLLPLQTQYIFRRGLLNGGPWEWGTLRLYVVQILIVAAALTAALISKKFRAQFNRPALLLFCALLFISILWAPEKQVAFAAAFSAGVAVALFLLARGLTINPVYARTAFIVGVILESLLAIYQTTVQKVVASTLLGIASHAPSVLGDAVVETAAGRWLRAYGGLPHPNIFGAFAAAALILLLAKRASFPKFFMPPAAAILTAGLFLSFSRSAWLAAALALVILMGRVVMRRVVAAGFWPMFTMIILTVLTLGIIFRSALISRFNFSGTTATETISSSERTLYKHDARKLIREQPFFGVGIGNMTYSAWLKDSSRYSFLYQPVHNIFYLITAEIGLVGLIIWLIAIWREIKIVRQGSDRLTLIILILPLAIFDHYLWTAWVGLILFWGLLALWREDRPQYSP